MPVHDWTRVSAGVFHDFHCGWALEIRTTLNTGLLPSDYYALVEQSARGANPDVLTLRATSANGAPEGGDDAGSRGLTTVTVAPPKVRFTGSLERIAYVARQRRVAIRHSSDDRIVALIELVSPGNKSGKYPFRKLIQKAASALARGYHLLLIDLFPPTPRDPQGVHGALWAALGDNSYVQPADKPLTLASYSAGEEKVYYVEPLAVGDSLPSMPLFLTPDDYVPVPLEATYQAAYRGVPARWRRVLEAPAS